MLTWNVLFCTQKLKNVMECLKIDFNFVIYKCKNNSLFIKIQFLKKEIKTYVERLAYNRSNLTYN